MNETNTKKIGELYDIDFDLWLEETVKLLKAQDFQSLDLPHLIQEMEDLGKSNRRELENRLITLFEHALKRCFTDLTQDYRGWTDTIRRNQRAIKRLLQDAPSLQPYVQQIMDECYRDALVSLEENPDYQTYHFPQNNPFPNNLDSLLNSPFWE